MSASRLRSLAPYALYAVASLYFCFPLLPRPDALAVLDWDQQFFYDASVMRSVFEYVQPPFWNPWYCGGNVLWQNPQIVLLSPIYLLATVVSLPLAVKITIVLHVFLGLAGMHVLITRECGLSFLPAVLFLSSVFALAGAPALHITVGHPWLLPFFYVPFLVFFVLRAVRTGAFANIFGAAAFSALAVYNGGTHAAAISGVGVVVFLILAAATRRDWRPIALLAAFGLAAVAYSAPRLVPVAYFVASDRFVDARGDPTRPDRTTVEAQVRAFLNRDQQRGPAFPDQRHGWHEFGDYIGVFAALLIVSSFIWIVGDRPWWKAHWLGVSLAVTSLALLLLAMGDFSTDAPYTLLNKIPPFTRFRNPSRYVLVFNLFAAAMVAYVAGTLTRERAAVGLRRFLAILFVLASIDVAYENRKNFVGVFSQRPLESGFHLLKPSARLIQDTTTSPYAPNSPMLRAMMNDRDVVDCYESLQLRRVIDPARVVVFADEPAKMFEIGFSPNRIQFRVLPGPQGSRVFLNQNYAPGWTSDAGPLQIDDSTGRAFVSLRPDQAGRFEFTFVPPGVWTGLFVFGAAVVASAMVWRRGLTVSKP